MTVLGFELTGPVVALGAITGMTYGVLAVGLVLVYRSNRIINFAHGEIGAFGASLAGVAVLEWGAPYVAAVGLAVASSAAVGALSEVLVIRRLRAAPVVMSVVATLGLGQALLLLSAVVNGGATAGQVYPQPSFLPSFELGALRVTPAYFGMLFVTPALVAGLAWFLRSRFGLAVRAAASNPEAARTAGVSVARMSALAWAVAGAVSAYTAILIRPTQGFVRAEALGPGLLLRALAAAVLARMTSLPIALAAGVALGVVEQGLIWNFPRAGLVEMALFVVILVGLLAQRRQGGREQERGHWSAVQAWPPLPDAVRESWPVRNARPVAFGAGLVAAAALAALSSDSAAVHLVVMAAFAVVGLSVGVVTGLSGQLSLGQFALAGVGAAASYHATRAVGNYALGLAAAAAAAAAASVVVAVPALRIRGLMLAVTTLSFALASSAWLLQQPWMLGGGVDPGRPAVGELVLDRSREYLVFALGVLGLAVWLASNVWRGGLGRRLRALRDNEDGARAFTVSATTGKLQGFVLGGAIAGLGGAVYGHALARLDAAAFPMANSVTAVVATVLGGLGLVAGPLLGVLYVVGVPRFLPLDTAGLAATAIGWLLVVLAVPGGFAQALAPVRQRLIAALAERSGDGEPAAQQAAPVEAARVGLVARASRAEPGRSSDPLLCARAVSKDYGGVRAVDAVSLEVRRGETVGLIGPNGAGKTTLFELLSGFAACDEGSVLFDGRDVTGLGPEERAGLGLIRSFQDAALFPTFTTLDCVKLALERRMPTRALASIVGVDRRERERDARARDLVALMGLDAYRDKPVRHLSTGTRRIAEIACLVALEPAVLLLDEPSAGIAQRETEALGPLLEQVKAHLGTSLVVIEHDMPLVMGLSDRVVALEAGKVIASGPPAEIQADPAVIAAYLGDARAPKQPRRRRRTPELAARA